MPWVFRPYQQLHWQTWPTAHTSDLVYLNSFFAYSCYLSINSNNTHIPTFIFPLVRGKYLYNDTTFSIQKCTRTSKIRIYPSKRQEHGFDYKLWKISDATHKGSKSVHRNCHVPCNTETNSEILYGKGPWKFPCILEHGH